MRSVLVGVFATIRRQPNEVWIAFVVVIVCIAFGIVDVLNDKSFGTLTTALGTAGKSVSFDRKLFRV
jgi:hypothetical protein